MAKHYIIESGLWSPAKTQKTKDGSTKAIQLPKKSLVKDDLDGAVTNDADLIKRVSAVAEALTDTVARGRIGSLKFMRAGVDNFEKWWSVAPAESKTRILMDEKHHKQLTDAHHARFASVVGKCPFRGPVPTPTEEEEEGKPKPAVNGGSPPKQGSARQATPPRK